MQCFTQSKIQTHAYYRALDTIVPSVLDFKTISTLCIHPILFNPTTEWESYRKTAAFTTLVPQESVIKSHFCGSTLQHVGVLLTEHKRRTTAAFPAARANDTTVITAWFLHLITIICANNYLKLRVKETLCCSFRVVNCTSKYSISIRKKKSPTFRNYLEPDSLLS